MRIVIFCLHCCLQLLLFAVAKCLHLSFPLLPYYASQSQTVACHHSLLSEVSGSASQLHSCPLLPVLALASCFQWWLSVEHSCPLLPVVARTFQLCLSVVQLPVVAHCCQLMPAVSSGASQLHCCLQLPIDASDCQQFPAVVLSCT